MFPCQHFDEISWDTATTALYIHWDTIRLLLGLLLVFWAHFVLLGVVFPETCMYNNDFAPERLLFLLWILVFGSGKGFPPNFHFIIFGNESIICCFYYVSRYLYSILIIFHIAFVYLTEDLFLFESSQKYVHWTSIIWFTWGGMFQNGIWFFCENTVVLQL